MNAKYLLYRENENEIRIQRRNNTPWEEIFSDNLAEKLEPKNPEWEIVAFRSPVGELYDRGITNLFKSDTDTVGRDLEWFFSMQVLDFPIHSVKRLSDGEVFSVGDSIADSKIVSFGLHKNSMRVYIRGVSMGGTQPSIDLADILKEKQPLFVTEDGKAIYERDGYVFVNEKFELFTNTAYAGVHHGPHPRFSTTEAAERFILNNKPCLSIQDIATLNPWKSDSGVPISFLLRMEQLVKSKI